MKKQRFILEYLQQSKKNGVIFQFHRQGTHKLCFEKCYFAELNSLQFNLLAYINFVFKWLFENKSNVVKLHLWFEYLDEFISSFQIAKFMNFKIFYPIFTSKKSSSRWRIFLLKTYRYFIERRILEVHVNCYWVHRKLLAYICGFVWSWFLKFL